MMASVEDNVASMGYNLVETLTGNDNVIHDYFSRQGVDYSQENVLTYGILRKQGMNDSPGVPSEGKVLLKQLRGISGPVAFTWSDIDYVSDIEVVDDGYLYAESSPGNSEPGMMHGKVAMQIIKLLGSKEDVDSILDSMDRLECGSGYKRIQIPMVKQDRDKKSLMRRGKVNMYLRKDDRLNPEFGNKLVICKDEDTFVKSKNKLEMGGAAVYSDDVSEWYVVQKGDL